MRIVLYDNNQQQLQDLAGLVKTAMPTSEIVTFSDYQQVNQFCHGNASEIAFVNCESQEALSLAGAFKETYKKTNIILVSDSDKYKANGMDLKASGYLINPLTLSMIKAELNDLRYPSNSKNNILLRVQCFGNFDVFDLDGNIVRFSRSKSKELFAYLISKQGTSAKIKELGAILFEDEEYDSKQQHYLQQLISSLGKTLKENNCEEVLIRNRNSISIDTRLLDCDYYRFIKGEARAKKLYNGDFMMQYEWADYIAAYLDRNLYD